MTPPIFIGAGLVALAIGALLLRSFGRGYRIGRLLSTPAVSVADARRIAADGRSRYVQVAGRIDSDVDFEDEHHRPLVFRRVRIETRRNGRWAPVSERRQAVDFVIADGLDAIAVDHDSLDEGVVVIPRVSSGVAGDIGHLLDSTVSAETEAQAIIEQVSSVEHAAVVGFPRTGPNGEPWMTSGDGRPLIVSTLDRDDAMRILAGGSRARPFAVAASLTTGVACVVIGLAWAIIGTLIR